MGCGCGGEESKEEHQVVDTKSPAVETIEAHIKGDGEGTWVETIYDAWPVDGEPTEVTMADGNKRKTWPLPWAEVKAFLDANGVDEAVSTAIHVETVENDKLPNITEECVTWPSVQNLIRRCWVGVNGEWIRADHLEEGKPYRGLLKMKTLSVKKEGLSKMLAEKGAEKFIDEMWEIYIKWPVDGDPTEVQRYNRKKLLLGEKVDSGKNTWPLPFEGDVSITQLMTDCDWNEGEIASLKTQLFDCKDESGVHPNCSETEVCWPDLQQVFRSVVSEDDWTPEDNQEWPPLDGRKTTLRLKVLKDQIKETLEGEYRMYCKPEEGEAFSYGLIIDNVDPEAGTFGGRSRVDGKYVVQDGLIHYDEKTGRLNVDYHEVWPDGTDDHLFARVKSNAKFQCESAGGFEQKASNETLNLPADPEDRIGENAKEGVKKYYLYDGDAATED
jgi:hypothetical protein